MIYFHFFCSNLIHFRFLPGAHRLLVLRYCRKIFNKLCLQGKLVTPALSELVSFNARDISNLFAALKTLEACQSIFGLDGQWSLYVETSSRCKLSYLNECNNSFCGTLVSGGGGTPDFKLQRCSNAGKNQPSPPWKKSIGSLKKRKKIPAQKLTPPRKNPMPNINESLLANNTRDTQEHLLFHH